MNFINSVVSVPLDITNFIQAVAILLFFAAMITLFVKAAIILRVQGDVALRASGLASMSLQVPRLKMTRVHIPFTLRLLDSGNNSYDEINLSVSSQINYTIQAFWAVSIRDLHMSLWRPWSELLRSTKSGCGSIVDLQHCQLIALNTSVQGSHSERMVTITSPRPPLLLGSPPRLAYPLVVFLIKDVSTDDLLHPDETVLLVNVIHLRDPVCPLPTSILAQYLKQANGQLSCLKQLYLAAGDPSLSADDNTCNGLPQSTLSLAQPVACAGTTNSLLCSDGPQLEQLCVVCHYFPLSRALLPCRHTCVCAICFAKLDRCPMCRAPINSYFCIRNEEYVPPGTMDSNRTNRSKGSICWLDSLNDRLTDFLGFR